MDQRGNQKVILKCNNDKTQPTKSMRYCKSGSWREAHSNTSLYQKSRKISNNLTYHLKELEKKKKELAKPKVRRRKGILKIGEEINKRD